MKRFFPAVAAVAVTTLVAGQNALAAITVPSELEPETMVDNMLALIAPYVATILSAVIVVTVGLALIRFLRRIPNRLAK